MGGFARPLQPLDQNLVEQSRLVLFFPLALVSNAIVPTGGMPSWLQAFAN
jgi:hypothetical protein